MTKDARARFVAFANEPLRKAYDTLKDGRFEDRQMYEFLGRAFDDWTKSADRFCPHL